MKKSFQKIIILALLLIPFTELLAQKRTIPGALYQPGDSLYGPRIGVYSKMPEGWMGVLPEGTEVFLLTPTTNPIGQIYVTTSEVSRENLVLGWSQGFELSDGLFLQVDGEVTERDNKLTARIKATSSSEFVGYIEAICGDFNNCLSAWTVTTPEFYDDLKKGIIQFMDNCEMVEPYEKDIYADLDWTLFLANKTLTSYEYEPGSKVINQVSLCADMTFQTNIKRKGALVKGDVKDYQGKKKGKWSMTNTGPESTIVLTFDKAPELKIPIRIDEEKVYINDKQYFTLPGERCK